MGFLGILMNKNLRIREAWKKEQITHSGRLLGKSLWAEHFWETTSCYKPWDNSCNSLCNAQPRGNSYPYCDRLESVWPTVLRWQVFAHPLSPPPRSILISSGHYPHLLALIWQVIEAPNFDCVSFMCVEWPRFSIWFMHDFFCTSQHIVEHFWLTSFLFLFLLHLHLIISVFTQTFCFCFCFYCSHFEETSQ